jgi:hypothetical protein
METLREITGNRKIGERIGEKIKGKVEKMGETNRK